MTISTMFRCTSCPRHWVVISEGPPPKGARCPDCGKGGRPAGVEAAVMLLDRQPAIPETKSQSRASARKQ